MMKQFVTLILRSLFALLLTCTFVSAENTPAAPRLQKLKHIVLSPTSEQVILQLNGSYSPKVFTLKGENPRVIFDFSGMTCGRDVKGVTTANGSIIKRVRVGMHEGNPPKTRVVFDVATFKGLHYTQKFNENDSTLVVQFTGSDKAAAPPQSDKAAAQMPAKETAVTAPASAGKAPEAASVQPEQAAVPPPSPAPDKQKKAAEQPVQPKPSQQTTQPASAPAKETAPTAAKQSTPDKAGTPSSASTKPVAEKSGEVQEKKAVQPETTAASSTATTKATDASATVRSEEPEKKSEQPSKETAAQPAPANKKEKKTKTTAQTQETSPQPEKAATKKAGEAAPDAGKSETVSKPAILAKATDKPQIEYVKFDDSSPKGEMVMFKLNGFHPPAIHGIEEGIPRVICDFNNTKLLQTNKGTVKTNGKFIKVIRTTTTKKPEKVRVVIDLEPNRSYDLQQVFFKEDNLFVLIVNTAKK